MPLFGIPIVGTDSVWPWSWSIVLTKRRSEHVTRRCSIRCLLQQPTCRPDHPACTRKEPCPVLCWRCTLCAAFPPHTDVLLSALCPPAPALHFLPQSFSSLPFFFSGFLPLSIHIYHPLLSPLPLSPCGLPLPASAKTSSSPYSRPACFTLDSYFKLWILFLRISLCRS